MKKFAFVWCVSVLLCLAMFCGVSGAYEFDKLYGYGTLQEVRAAIQAGADVNARCEFDRTPLGWAAWGTNTEVADLLVREGADVNAIDNGGMSPLMWASWRDDTELVNLLIRAGADVNAKDIEGNTPLIWSIIHSDNPEVMLALVLAGADVNAKNDEGRSALDFAMGYDALKGTEALEAIKRAARK